MRRPSTQLATALLLGTLGCGGSAEDAPQGRKTNLDVYLEHQGDAPVIGDEAEEQAVAAFRRVWAKHKPVFRSRFLGIPTAQNPADAWIVQEIISEVKPDVIVETGTYKGGSAALWALILENVNAGGRVVTIDIEDQRDPSAMALPIWQRRVDFLLGSSTAPEIVAEVAQRVAGKRALVLLDSLHTKEHVAAELAAYAPLVPPGSYLIVQDTPVGPIEAVDEFLEAHPGWVADDERERFRITNTVRGYLRRVR